MFNYWFIIIIINIFKIKVNLFKMILNIFVIFIIICNIFLSWFIITMDVEDWSRYEGWGMSCSKQSCSGVRLDVFGACLLTFVAPTLHISFVSFLSHVLKPPRWGFVYFSGFRLHVWYTCSVKTRSVPRCWNTVGVARLIVSGDVENDGDEKQIFFRGGGHTRQTSLRCLYGWDQDVVGLDPLQHRSIGPE